MNVVIVQTVDKNDFVIQCGYCRGRGLKPRLVIDYQISDYTSETCDICNGKGVLRVQVTDILIPDARCQATALNDLLTRTRYPNAVLAEASRHVRSLAQ